MQSYSNILLHAVRSTAKLEDNTQNCRSRTELGEGGRTTTEGSSGMLLCSADRGGGDDDVDGAKGNWQSHVQLINSVSGRRVQLKTLI